MADANDLYKNTKLVGSSDSFCETCQITTIRSAPRGGPKDDMGVDAPGKCFQFDIVTNPTHQALTRTECVEHYLAIVCWCA